MSLMGAISKEDGSKYPFRRLDLSRMAFSCAVGVLAGFASIAVILPAAPPSPRVPARQLTLEDIEHTGNLIAPAINTIHWRPAPEPGKASIDQLTFVSPNAGSSEGAAICEYDLRTGRTSVLFDPTGRTETFDLSSYQWSPRGDEILLLRRE